MQELKVLGVENGYIVVSTPAGDRYGVRIDEVLPLGLKQSNGDGQPARKLSPREVQTHIRAGMSAADVAKITGVPLDYIQRFEGPVLAEREFMVESALNVPVHLAIDSDPAAEPATFGGVIRDRLQSIGATDERWASWKEQGGGWIVKLSFTVDGIERDARWGFEPRSQSLAPGNQEATTLSQQGDLAAAMIPRLRAVGLDEKPVDASRFDSGAFVVEKNDLDELPQRETVPIRPLRQPVAEAAITREVPVQQAPSQTADLLEALRRRRGERESAQYDLDGGTPSAAHPASGAIRVVEISTPKTPEPPALEAAPQQPTDDVAPATNQRQRQRRGRQPMPSWDEIVFGSKNEDDHA
jgi:hypothetical protein